MFEIILQHLWALVLYGIIFLPAAFLLYHVVRGFLGEPHLPSRVLPFILLTTLNWDMNRLMVLYINGLNVFCTLIWHGIILWVVFDRRGWRVVLDTLKLMIMTILMELSCSLFLTLFHKLGINENDLLVLSLQDMLTPIKVILSSIMNCLGLVPLLLGVLLWEKLRSRGKQNEAARRQQRLHTRAILRVSGLAIAGLSMLAMPHFLFGNDAAKLVGILDGGKYLVLILCVGLLLFICISYMTQDIRYILQTKRLTTLEHQQAISRSLLQNLRFFRHNMVNMLYGLEGVLISGDREQVTDYYRQMQEKCALVNNENIAALERVTNHSVGALLLHGVDKARQLNLPMNLYVQEAVHFGNALRDTDLCQVLGVLQDNAIEAADKAEERFVSIEIRNVESAVEIIIKNTYSGQIDPHRLTHGGTSTKEGHSGHGLESCYHILSRRKGAFLNFWVTGQYVQAQLLLER